MSYEQFDRYRRELGIATKLVNSRKSLRITYSYPSGYWTVTVCYPCAGVFTVTPPYQRELKLLQNKVSTFFVNANSTGFYNSLLKTLKDCDFEMLSWSQLIISLHRSLDDYAKFQLYQSNRS